MGQPANNIQCRKGTKNLVSKLIKSVESFFCSDWFRCVDMHLATWPIFTVWIFWGCLVVFFKYKIQDDWQSASKNTKYSFYQSRLKDFYVWEICPHVFNAIDQIMTFFVYLLALFGSRQYFFCLLFNYDNGKGV